MWFGLARRRTLFLPTWKGWLLLALLLALTLFAFAKNAYRFLALNTSLTQADVLLVEGWVSDHTLAKAVEEFEAGRCRWICTSGVDLERGQRLSEWNDWASVAGATLEELGVPTESLPQRFIKWPVRPSCSRRFLLRRPDCLRVSM